MSVMRRIRNLFTREKVEREIDAELRAHIEMRTADNIAAGMTAEEARRDALLKFGNPVVMKEKVTGMDAALGLEGIWADLRYALRQLRRAPNFTIAAILTLALGIGANTAIFSVINAVLLKPLSYPHPDRIVQFMLGLPGGARPSASVQDFRLWREQSRVFHDVSAYDFSGAAMSVTGDMPEQIRGVHVTANYFRLFGVPMVLGRTFTTEEDRPNGGKVVVLSYGLWKRKFGGDPNIVGKAISLEKEPYTVIGVTGQRFQPDPVGELWIPLQLNLNSSDQLHYLRVAGRLNSGVSLEQANAQLKLVANEARRSSPLADPELGYTVEPLRNAMVRDVRSSLLLMGGAVSFVLLIACANVANLLLIRATGRKREFAIRAALGAGRRRILCQLLTESMLLSFAGGVLGLGLGLVGMRALLAVSPGDIPRIGENGAAVGLDWRVLVFTLSVSLLTGILFGLVPALRAARPDLNDALKEGGNQQGTGFRQNKARSLFVISEVALAVALLIGAALLIRTFVALRAVNPGFQTHNVVTMDMPLAKTHFAKTASVAHLVRDARQQLNDLPGVQVSAATCCPPFADRMGLPFVIVGRKRGNSSSMGGDWLDATPGYFDVFKIPILRGRDFTEQDDAGAPPVVLINEAMAKQYWPNENPIGQQILIGGGEGPQFQDVPRQIIGVVGDARDTDLSQPADATMILPLAQEPDGMNAITLKFAPIYWLVRTRVEPHSMAAVIAEQLRKSSGGLPVGHIRSMDEVMLHSISRRDFNMLLLAIFAAAALALAAVGIYGVMAYSIAQRTQEIGIRMALGADRARIRNLVLRQGMLLAIVGVMAGVGMAFGLARLLAGFLFGVTAWDPMVFLLVPALVSSVALLAVWVPARRAMRVDPMQALRSE